MTETRFEEVDRISGYHAHVYYDAASKDAAAALRAAVEARFAEVRMGRWHDRPVGPHPCWSYQIAFEPALFGDLVPWLSLNRDGLVVLVHPRTGDDVRDHSELALWLGPAQELDIGFLERLQREGDASPGRA